MHVQDCVNLAKDLRVVSSLRNGIQVSTWLEESYIKRTSLVKEL